MKVIEGQSPAPPGSSEVRLPLFEERPVPKRVVALALSAWCLLCLLAPAAAPPALAGWEKLIEQLGSADYATRKAAEKKLTERGGDVAAALREVGRGHADVDVRLRASVIAAAIEK